MGGRGGAGLARRHPLLAGLACITAGVLAAAALLAGGTPLAFLPPGPAGVWGSADVAAVADPAVVEFFEGWLEATELVPGTVDGGDPPARADEDAPVRPGTLGGVDVLSLRE